MNKHITFQGRKHTPESIKKMIVGKRSESRTTSRLFRQIDSLTAELGVPEKKLSKKLGRELKFWDWRSGTHTPNVLTLEEIADFLGYEFVLQKKEPK